MEKSSSTQSIAVREGTYRFRKATLLDVPFMYNLMWEGSYEGGFTDGWLSGKGGLAILRILFRDLLAMPFAGRNTCEAPLLIFMLQQRDIGFIRHACYRGKSGQVTVRIDLFAIEKAFQHQRHGSMMLKMFLETQSQASEVVAYCNKYARVMRHMLHRAKFKRDKNEKDQLAVFRLGRHAGERPDSAWSG